MGSLSMSAQDPPDQVTLGAAIHTPGLGGNFPCLIALMVLCTLLCTSAYMNKPNQV